MNQNFVNPELDISQLPKFEEVRFLKLEPIYWKVVLISLFLFLGAAFIGLLLLFYVNEEVRSIRLEIFTVFGVAAFLLIGSSRIAFKKKGYAFRQHDALYQSGILANKVIIIPYNRVQHVAVHEGLLSRLFNLAEVQLFTAGASGSDIQIPGIKKDQAEAIKQLLMVKINKEL